MFKWTENANPADSVKIKTALFKALRIVNLNYFQKMFQRKVELGFPVTSLSWDPHDFLIF